MLKIYLFITVFIFSAAIIQVIYLAWAESRFAESVKSKSA